MECKSCDSPVTRDLNIFTEMFLQQLFVDILWLSWLPVRYIHGSNPTDKGTKVCNTTGHHLTIPIHERDSYPSRLFSIKANAHHFAIHHDVFGLNMSWRMIFFFFPILLFFYWWESSLCWCNKSLIQEMRCWRKYNREGHLNLMTTVTKRKSLIQMILG